MLRTGCPEHQHPMSCPRVYVCKLCTGNVLKHVHYKTYTRDFPGGTVVKNLPANAGDTGSIPGPARSHMLRSN